MIPNLVIFKHPTNSCVEFTYYDSVLSKTGDIFECPTYNDLTHNEIVLARVTAEGSTELSRYEINSHGPQNIFELCYNELSLLVNHLISNPKSI
jgi:hypothetical protein